MKGVILAGGKGTRLSPITKVVNKHLLPVGKHPMIEYSIIKLKEAGVRDILLVTGSQSAGLFFDYLRGGDEWGVRITYRLQDEAGGIAQALGLAEDFILPGEKFIVLLGDNLFEESLRPHAEAFTLQEKGARVLIKEVADPSRYGVPIIQSGRILHIEEKPKTPPSSYSVTGIYMYDSAVFQVIASIEPSGRGEFEITDVNNVYAAENLLTYGELSGWWIDAGTFESLHRASSLLLGNEAEDRTTKK